MLELCKIAITKDRLKTFGLANNIAKIMESFAIETEWILS